LKGYAGDGVFCIPTINELILNHPNLTKVAAFVKVSIQEREMHAQL
jgi:hypothetical protein